MYDFKRDALCCEFVSIARLYVVSLCYFELCITRPESWHGDEQKKRNKARDRIWKLINERNRSRRRLSQSLRTSLWASRVRFRVETNQNLKGIEQSCIKTKLESSRQQNIAESPNNISWIPMHTTAIIQQNQISENSPPSAWTKWNPQYYFRSNHDNSLEIITIDTLPILTPLWQPCSLILGPSHPLIDTHWWVGASTKQCNPSSTLIPSNDTHP